MLSPGRKRDVIPIHVQHRHLQTSRKSGKENLNYSLTTHYTMCFVDASMIFFPIAFGALSYTGVKLYRKYKESKQKANTEPTTVQ